MGISESFEFCRYLVGVCCCHPGFDITNTELSRANDTGQAGNIIGFVWMGISTSRFQIKTVVVFFSCCEMKIQWVNLA